MVLEDADDFVAFGDVRVICRAPPVARSHLSVGLHRVRRDRDAVFASKDSVHVILPTQYLHGAESRQVEPHRRLMAAVLQTVVDDCRERSGVGRTTLRKALAYAASTDRTWPFSFENLCEALELNANCLRMEL